MKPTDLAALRLPGMPTVSPDGRTAIVALTRADLDADDYTSQLWLVPTDGGAPRQLTHGWRDGSPGYSPDGRWLAFLRAEREGEGAEATTGKPQLWLLPTDGGEARRLTDHPIGAGAPEWSPDSTRLAYTARVPEEGRYGTVPGRDADREPPRRLTRLFYRVDGVGYTFDRPRHVFVIDVAGLAGVAGSGGNAEEPVQVTKGDFDHRDVSWSPDGEWLVFVSARHPERDCDLRNDLWVCRPDGSDARALTDGGFDLEQPRFTPDGRTVYFAGYVVEGRHGHHFNQRVWSVPADGSAPPAGHTDAERYNLAAPDGRLLMTPEGVVFPNENRGSVQLLRLPYGGGEPEVLMDGDREVIYAARADDGRFVTTVVDPRSWGELVVRSVAGEERVLTDWGAPSTVEVRPQEELNATAPDGYPVHGWVVRPAADGPHPVLLMVHGGPFAQYGWRLFDEAQVYAAAGYAVVMGNPRGSSGYGEAHGTAIVGNVGEVSAVDLLALLDAALAADDLDANRVGVLGGSHGGFMTTWMAAHHGDRFKAAVSERAVNAIDSFTGSSDIGWFFADDLYGEDVGGQQRQSPLTHADRITIPMLIIHSEQDWRCPVEQAQRLFVALRRREVPVELLVFPGEGHELSRSGLPSHRIARFDAIVDWWRRYL